MKPGKKNFGYNSARALRVSFIKGSFDKIKNSVGDLVQINVIFFGYADQLHLLMQQSRRKTSDIFLIVDKINVVVLDAVKTIQRYCEVTPSKS